MDEKTVTLINIANGAAPELFQRELVAVLDNIADVNTGPTAKRKIKLEFIFEPNEDRESGDVRIVATSALAAVKGTRTRLWFGKKNGRYRAVESDPRQPGLFDQKPQA